MALHVTRCPGCDSSFNTSAGQLQAAHGLVRCGACLTVFQAQENFITPAPPDPEDATGGSVFLSNNDEYLDVARFVRTATGLYEQRRYSFDTPDLVPDHAEPAGELPAVAADEVPMAATAESAPPVPATVTIEVTRDADTNVDEGFLQAVEEAVEDVAPAPVFTLGDGVDDADPALAPDQPEFTAADTSPEPATDTAAAPEPPATMAPATAPAAATEDPKETLRARLRDSNLVAVLDDDLEPLAEAELSSLHHVPDPLELEQLTPARRWQRTALWSVLCLVLLAGLAGQFLWQRFPLLSLHPDLRPIYQLACDIIGCRLPPVEDLVNLQLENLVVRTHPAQPGALQISAVLRNNAGFQQPFPVLRLQFRDQTLQPVAGRDFQPAEYLPPALRSIANIPINTPVQFSLDLVDPGPDAVNYELNFVSGDL